MAHAIDYLALRTSLLSEFGRGLIDQVRVPPRVHWPTPQLVELRAEQKTAVENWQSADGRGLIVMPTGTGKTEVALAIIGRGPVWPRWSSRRCAI